MKFVGITCGTSSLVTFSWIVLLATSAACCVEITTVWTRTGLSFSSYSTVSWDLASGVSHSQPFAPDFRSWASFSTNRCE